MCILCVIQKWSRRVATMLPWLVIPLIGLWALSQLLPPAFRFEITSPKLACVFVLLVTLFWYEILMPHLSAWRVRRNAQLREMKRTEAIELQKLRKTATRKCRNCLTPYRDQNPGGGRFMCSYCGHISKRPVLDLHIPPGLELSSSGLIKDLVGRSGKMLNGKAWSENGWICSHDWIENNNWVSGPVAGKSSHWRKNGTSRFFGGDDDCMAERSYSGLVIFACKLLTSFFMSIRWLWRKISRVSSSKELNSSDADHREMLAKRGENGVNFHESRGEKARRKAEEKRQARLEKELEEEEERKQREEVARLVEERRKLRDEILEAERGISKLSTPSREKESKKEAERKRQERRKDKDKGSSKSNSDVEELDKKAGKESERKRDLEKKYETERRDHHKPGLESVKGQNFESGNVVKNSTPSNFGRGNTGSRYLDRMRGTFLSSSRAFGGTGFFGRTSSAPVMKENKFTNSVDHAHNSSFRRDICPPERVVGKLNALGDDKNVNRPVILDPQPRVAPKKSWQQLFTLAGATTTPANSSVISRPNPKIQVDGNGPQLPSQPPVMQSFDNPISFGLPSPFTLSSHHSIPSSGSLGFSPPVEPIFHHVVDRPCEIVPEEPELFEDPCYIPDPMSLLGPVSESLDNFQLDLGMDRPHTLKNVLVSPEVNKPSPIESPLARIRVTDESHNSTSWLPTTPKAQDMHTLLGEDTNVNQTGTWQMWKSSPLGQDGLGLVGASGSWRLPQEWNKSTREDSLQPSSQKTMTSLFSNDDQVFSGNQSPRKSFVGNGLNGGVFSPSAGSSLVEPWLHKAAFPPLSGNDDHFPVNAQDESSQNEMIYGSVSRAATNHSFESSPVNRWSKKELAVQGSREGFTNFAVTKPQTGSLSPPAPDVQSLWSFQ